MESALSTLSSRIRRTFRRHTGEVQSINHQPRIEQRRGRPSQRVRVEDLSVNPGEWEAAKETRKRTAAEVLELIDHLESKGTEVTAPRTPREQEMITKLGMLKILLNLVKETGVIPDPNKQSIQQSGLLTRVEMENLGEMIPALKSILKN
ncbi:C protein [Mount Mabu Lophuromys virus 2]|uniref:C protein n=1 Tax=Mount Mabu Lophuromys virus 2 TaxID=2116560 RepID=A0A2P1GJ91_9MONO|nr:C protein [Mount Mabu Lophuromys virus 2]AVM86022.1 C protein [Mount Mabu Lophuromys virus 2]